LSVPIVSHSRPHFGFAAVSPVSSRRTLPAGGFSPASSAHPRQSPSRPWLFLKIPSNPGSAILAVPLSPRGACLTQATATSVVYFRVEDLPFAQTRPRKNWKLRGQGG